MRPPSAAVSTAQPERTGPTHATSVSPDTRAHALCANRRPIGRLIRGWMVTPIVGVTGSVTPGYSPVCTSHPRCSTLHRGSTALPVSTQHAPLASSMQPSSHGSAKSCAVARNVRGRKWFGAYPTLPVSAQCICGTLHPHPSSVESASVTMPKGLASEAGPTDGKTALQLSIMRWSRQAYPSPLSTFPTWNGRLFSPWYHSHPATLMLANGNTIPL
mmetsp:Transcript_37503/g.98364  ORF Transcript_37503/g.98364 Transcript_37503/m.98364 type:complete len:216 (-) Transcript_37503:929-1576(-)